jgi:hypothetical protein
MTKSQAGPITTSGLGGTHDVRRCECCGPVAVHDAAEILSCVNKSPYHDSFRADRHCVPVYPVISPYDDLYDSLVYACLTLMENN